MTFHASLGIGSRCHRRPLYRPKVSTHTDGTLGDHSGYSPRRSGQSSEEGNVLVHQKRLGERIYNSSNSSHSSISCFGLTESTVAASTEISFLSSSSPLTRPCTVFCRDSQDTSAS